ncbi:uncharacterized protein LOC114522251 [Dendronephthya gigantea]|uniref:uncharacterized protein LOC114522251 n=1 Tax=Dendronephthya gigantea TaxID=151771 RepID=UPI00106BA140|nr:uncharacterized protein LOC114522251 [Dendronephthya gigantea]
MADPRQTVNRLLDRISELADAISPQVEAETRRIFRNENVKSIPSNTSSSPSFVVRQNDNTQQAVIETPPQPTRTHGPTTATTSQTPAMTAAQPQPPNYRRTFVARRQFGGQRSTFRTQRQRQRNVSSRPKVTDTRPFMRDLVLLSGPDDTIVPRQGSRLTLMEKGHVISGCRFTKAMNAVQVHLAIIEAFDGKIPDGVDIELLMSVHTSLVAPTLAPGQHGIDGAMLQRLFQNKPVYVRPSRQLIPQRNETSQQPTIEPTDLFSVTDEELNQAVETFEEQMLRTTTAPSTDHQPGPYNVLPPDVLTPPVQQHSAPGIVPPATSVPPIDLPDSGFVPPPTTLATQNPNVTVPEPVISSIAIDNLNDDISVASDDDLPQVLFVEESALRHPKEIFVPRSNLLKEVIEQFKVTDILDYNITFVIVADNNTPESGRGSGVTREVLSIFWKEFQVSLATGASEKVPSIRHDYQKDQWVSIARVLVFGFRSHKYFPIFLSKAFLITCLFGEDVLTKETLFDSFSSYMSTDENDTMQKSLKGEIAVDDDDLLDLLSSYKCYRQPAENSMQKIFEELAHQELVQKPKYIADAWGPYLQPLKDFQEFLDVNTMSTLYEEKRPTSKRVIKLLKAEPSSNAERECLDHLKRYIKSLGESQLSGLLQFVTGCNIITVDEICVTFTDAVGISRRIVAHTCGPLLELPSTFQTYNELSEEFSKILANVFAWSFEIV